MRGRMTPLRGWNSWALIARRYRHVPLQLLSVERFDDGLVQIRYSVRDVSVDFESPRAEER
jgi:hypothetical protein